MNLYFSFTEFIFTVTKQKAAPINKKYLLSSLTLHLFYTPDDVVIVQNECFVPLSGNEDLFSFTCTG